MTKKIKVIIIVICIAGLLQFIVRFFFLPVINVYLSLSNLGVTKYLDTLSKHPIFYNRIYNSLQSIFPIFSLPAFLIAWVIPLLGQFINVVLNLPLLSGNQWVVFIGKEPFIGASFLFYIFLVIYFFVKSQMVTIPFVDASWINNLNKKSIFFYGFILPYFFLSLLLKPLFPITLIGIDKIPIGDRGIYYRNIFNTYVMYKHPKTGGWLPLPAIFEYLDSADPGTFKDIYCSEPPEWMCKSGFAKDKRYVYFFGKLLPNVDPATFRFVANKDCISGEPCFIDKNATYIYKQDSHGNETFNPIPHNP